MRSIKKSIRLKNVNYEIRGNIINNVTNTSFLLFFNSYNDWT